MKFFHFINSIPRIFNNIKPISVSLFFIAMSFMFMGMYNYMRDYPDNDVFINEKDHSELVWIPGGVFLMGGSEINNESPQSKITVDGFWLSKYEITNRQYALFLAEENHQEPPFWDDPDYNKPDQPVVGIKWIDAVAYCQWAGLRLPTELEWEYAAAYGQMQFEYGTSTGKINHDLANYAGVNGKDIWEFSSPVGSFPPNPFGIYDMAGNAWEWCSTIYKPYPYDPEDGREIEETENNELRIMRGGSWHFNHEYCKVTNRRYHKEHLMYDYAGFRVAYSGAKK